METSSTLARAALILAAALAAGHAAAADLTLERIVADPPLAGGQPRQVEFSPGGAWVSELRPAAGDSKELELWARPAAGGAARRLASAKDLLGGRAEALTEAERMALERKRIGERGITSYQWCGQGDAALLFPLSGDLYLATLDGRVRRLRFDAQQPAQDPVCSADGRQLAYVQGGNLWIQALDAAEGSAAAAPRRLTDDGGANNVGWGLAEFVAAEELARERGFWWAPDGRSLLVLRVDESPVPLKTRAQIFADRTEMVGQRYPGAGSANARVTAWRVDAASGQRVALALPAEAEYISRAGWFGDGTPWLQWLTRDQQRMVVTEFDADAAGAAVPRDLIDERDAAWVEVQQDLAELKGVELSGKPALLWSSEVSGRRQLQLVDRTSGERRALTHEPEPVAHVVCNDGRQVVFAAARERGRARELFVVGPDGATRPLVGDAEHAWRDAVGDAACARLIVTRSAWGQPPQLAVESVADGTTMPLPGNPPDPLLAAAVQAPQALDLVAADGHTALNAFYFAPRDGRPGPHAVLTLAYGGPGAETVSYAWSRQAPLIAHWQREGYGVFMVDTRGMAGRDRAFTRAHEHAFGVVEVADLFAAVRQLPTLVPDVDPARIGFFGWSYGGFLAARAMLDKTTPLAAAVAVAPPTDWTLYDTAYTERYLGLPDGGRAPAYVQADLTRRAAELSKPLLIVHGTADDNVLFENSLRLIQALQAQGKLFELDIFPGLAHGLNGGPMVQLHLWRTLDAFFARTLRP